MAKNKKLSKTKLAKIKDKKQASLVENKEYFYFAKEAVSVKNIYDAILEEMPKIAEKTEMWEAAEVLEITTGEKSSIDIEKIPMFRDEEDVSFVNENGFAEIFSIKCQGNDEEKLKGIFERVIPVVGGMLCPDTIDFMPVLVKL